MKSRLLRTIAIAFKLVTPYAKLVGLHRLRVGPYRLGEWARRFILPEQRLLVTSFGTKIYSDSAETLTKLLIWDGHYEAGTTRVLERLLEKGEVVIDIGAHIGYYTLLACKMVGPTGKVYAFEPAPQNYRLIEHNLALNNFRNASVACQAVADVDDIVKFWLSEKSHWHSLFPQKASHQTTVSVQATTLDSFLAKQGWPRIEVIKIDVEGAELAVLKGMRETLRRNPRVKLVLEFSPGNLNRAGVDPVDLIQFLVEEGFRLEAIDEPSGMLRPFGVEDVSGLTANASFSYLNILADRAPVQGGKSMLQMYTRAM